MADKDDLPGPLRQWEFFADFCRYDGAAGGPDPHMKTAGWLVKGLNKTERLWMAGCYMGTYVVPSAEAIFQKWNLADIAANPDELEPWLRENWAGVVLRRERRAVRTPTKLARYLLSYAEWLSKHRDDPWVEGSPEATYEDAWKALSECWGVGRYIAIKGLEFMYQHCGTSSAMTDLRAKGGWSPREALACLLPEYAAPLSAGDTAENCAYVDKIAGQAKTQLEYKHGVALSWYEFQTFLCDWKQCYFGRRQYPGRSLDSEVGHAAKVWAHFPAEESRLLEARAALFPAECLAEVGGWDGVREPLGNCQSEWNYTWSDLVYDWNASQEAPAFPQPRQQVLA